MTSKSMTLKFYSDPAHGWLAVKRELLYDLGIAAKVSFYSYERGKTVYLEEDCDMPILIRALDERGIGVQLEERHTDNLSPIRGYNHYFA
jgi:hypothetical protein